jgi:protein involved in polysaccharide export with SLBB domain/beta-lactamase regulating signal transducer with metallopeptidase domain
VNLVLDSLGSPPTSLIVQRLGWTLVHSLWQGVIIAAALAGLLRLLKRAPANFRYIASCCAMAMLLLVSGITFALLRGELRDPFMAPLIDDQPTLRLPSAVAAMPVHAQSRDIMESPTNEPARRDLKLIVLAWAIGVLAMSIWHIGGWLMLARFRRGDSLRQWEPALAKLRDRLHIRRAVALIESARLDVPAVIGALRPVIVVPIGIFSGLVPQQVEAILAHELAHIRRHDYLVNLIQSAIETLLFYHPATWWISAQIRRERENCCDDIAAAVCGSDRDYAAALAALEERRGRVRIAMAATGGSLMERVRRVLRLPPAHEPRNRIHSLAAAALAIALVAAPIACVTAPRTVHGEEQKGATRPADLNPAAPATSTVSAIQPDDLKPAVQDYRTGPDDLLSVSITDLVGPGVETVKQARVSETGSISLPIVGVLSVKGLSAPEAEKTIAKAYQDAGVLKNAQVSVSVVDARQRLFSVLGNVQKPGQYAIAASDFRLLDAVALSGGRVEPGAKFRIHRAADGRQLEIKWDQLAAGDMGVNVVIRPHDTIIVDSAPHKFVKVVIGKETLLYQGKTIGWSELYKMFDEMSESDRRVTVLEIAAASPNVTVERFFNVSGQLSDLVKRYHLAYLSETGIQPTTEPAVGPRADVGEYYMSGVKRVGVYSLTARKVTLKQALMAAGGTEAPSRIAKVTVVRRDGEKETSIVKDLPVDDLTEGKTDDPYLKPNDMIIVKPDSTIAAMELGALIKQREAIAGDIELLKQQVGVQSPQLKGIQEHLKQLDDQIEKLGGSGWTSDTAMTKPAPATTPSR